MNAGITGFLGKKWHLDVKRVPRYMFFGAGLWNTVTINRVLRSPGPRMIRERSSQPSESAAQASQVA